MRLIRRDRRRRLFRERAEYFELDDEHFLFKFRLTNDAVELVLDLIIDELEPKKQKSNAGATLPRPGESSPQEEDHDDHDHTDDDEDWE
jgi:hypothetical protein